MKINTKFLENTIVKAINENLYYSPADIGADYDSTDEMDISDAEYDSMIDKYVQDHKKDDKPNWSTASHNISDLPFESKNTINELQLRNIVKETIVKILKENYPLGAEYDPRAPWNEPETTSEMMEIQGTAYYYNEKTEEEKVVPFEIEVEVDGEYLVDYDDGERYSYFQPNEDTDYYSLVIDSGKIPQELDGGFRLEDIDVDKF